MSAPARSRTPPVGEWPANGLEFVDACPVCGERRRQVLHEGLQDRVYFCAPGKWTLYACENCGSAYLDPRPNQATVGEAYRTYYTHGVAAAELKIPKSFRRRFRLSLRNGYLNARYGYQFTLASNLGPVLCSTARKREADRWVRHLHFPNGPPRLLDVGCGNGDFLVTMRAAGWQVQGLDLDAEAVTACQKAGLAVRQGMLADQSFPKEHFAAITLCHVIEHLHDPRETLRLCHKFLRPDGVLWIATPSLDAAGHKRSGGDWVGLDPPRHLVLFTLASLRATLEKAGFRLASDTLSTVGAEWFFRTSAAVGLGNDPMQAMNLPHAEEKRLKREAHQADRQASRLPGLAEEIVLLATKLDTAPPSQVKGKELA